jgi:hypothetical protein
MSETHGSIETRRPKGLPPVCLPPPCPRGRYDVGSFASTGFDPQESFRSMKAAWPSAAIALGVMVGRGRGGAGASPGGQAAVSRSTNQRRSHSALASAAIMTPCCMVSVSGFGASA